MVERGDEPSFPFKALVERLTHDFDGDLATQPVIFSFVDLPHAACGDEAENAEAAAKNLAFGERAARRCRCNAGKNWMREKGSCFVMFTQQALDLGNQALIRAVQV